MSFDGLRQDLRYAFRQLRRSPGFAVVVVLTLALGIGANATIFSIVNALFLRPPAQVRAPQQLVWIYTSDFSGPLYGASSYPDFEAFREQKDVLAGAMAFSPRSVNLVDRGRTTRLMAELVSSDYFDVLGARPELGSGFSALGGKDAAPAVVISHGLWQRAFSGDPGMVGQAVDLNGSLFTVVGIAAPGYRGAIRGLQVDAWIPFEQEPLLTGKQDFIGQPGNRGLFVIGRLRPGVGAIEAQAHFRVLAAQLFEAHPENWKDVKEHGRQITVVPERVSRVPMMLRAPALGLTGLLCVVVGLVLLLCCANVANLVLVRAVGRGREFGVRLTLGASRRRLVRQLITESVVLATLGGLAGLLLAAWGVRLFLVLLPPMPVPLHLDVAPDWRVLLFAAAATMLTALLFGLAPALRSAGADLVPALKQAAPLGIGRKPTLQSVLVVVQVAVSLVLLVGAGLFVRSLLAAQHVDVGLDSNGVVIAAVDTQGYKEPQRAEFYRELQGRLGRLPAVSGVALGSSVPFNLLGSRTGTGVEGYEPRQGEDMEFHFAAVGPDYFRVLHIPLLRGRSFTSADRQGAPAVAIVNEAFASRFWPHQDPIGKRLTYSADLKNLTVVGVVPTGKYVSPGEEPTPFIYLSCLQTPDDMLVHVRATGDSGQLISRIRRAIHEIDPNLPITTLSRMPEVMAAALLPQRIGAAVLSLFALLAMLLAAVGLYGVMAAIVSYRTREIGVRIALGGGRRSIVGLIVGRGLRVTAIGLAIGLVLAGVLSHFASHFLFGIGTLDPAAFVGMTVLFVVVAALAAFVPARRASRVDPMETLRSE